MIAPLAKLPDWLAIQFVWGRRVKSLLKLHNHPPNPKLEEALQFLKGPDFIPVESSSAQLEFIDARNFRFPTPRPGEFAENNVVYGRLYRCAERWQKRPVIILLHGADGDPDYHFEFPLMARQCNRAGLTACRDARLSAAVLVAPGLDLNVFLSAAKQIVWPCLRAELLRQQPACEALNRTTLNLVNARPCVPKENILLIEAIHDLFVDRKSMEALWHAWGRPDIWRLPHGHASKILSPGLTGRILRWLAPRLDAPAVRTGQTPH